MIFKGQTITLGLDTDDDLSGFDGYIKYRKPNGTYGQWTGTIVGDTINYDVQVEDIDVAGTWTIQAYAEDGDERRYGNKTVIEFRTPL